jgi:hypothetical protein
LLSRVAETRSSPGLLEDLLNCVFSVGAEFVFVLRSDLGRDREELLS